MKTLREHEYTLLKALSGLGSPISVDELAARLSIDQSQVAAAGAVLQEAGFVESSTVVYQEFRLGPVGQAMAAGTIPERAVIAALQEAGGQATIQELSALSGLKNNTIGQCLRFLFVKGWAEKEGPRLKITEEGLAALEQPGPDEQLLGELNERGPCTDKDLQPTGIDLSMAQKYLKGRKGVLLIKSRKRRLLNATEAGRQISSRISMRRQVNQLTDAMLLDGSWRDVDFRPYDMSVATEPIYPGKVHPLGRILDQTRRVFLEMGFQEIASPFVESSFWNFDALFQPQDHPARDMQDTFYVQRPAKCSLPASSLVETIGNTHQDGGGTGSLGWGYSWDKKLARQPVLRTHTTASTIRALANNPNPPSKVFCVGKVFRRETLDYKHLPVFYQVDGIIVDEKASFATLLGTLSAFYEKMGFRRFEFRPAFFPYTEPSVEVFVYMEEKRDWVEMGGAGVFRPEVTEPLGCHVPVLAWGLGLERLAMFRYDISDIRDIYVADLKWLKEAELCR